MDGSKDGDVGLCGVDGAVLAHACTIIQAHRMLLQRCLPHEHVRALVIVVRCRITRELDTARNWSARRSSGRSSWLREVLHRVSRAGVAGGAGTGRTEGRAAEEELAGPPGGRSKQSRNGPLTFNRGSKTRKEGLRLPHVVHGGPGGR